MLVWAFDPPVEGVGADAVVVGVDVVVDVEGVVDVLLVSKVEEPPVDLVAGDELGVGVDHHLVEYAFVVLPLVSDPEAETGVVVGTGAVLEDVFDELWVLAVPPASVGWTLIAGWILNVGSMVIVGVELAVAPPTIIFMRPIALRPCWAEC